MSTKRRVAAASADSRLRRQKRRKVSDDDLVEPEESDHASPEPAEEPEAEGSPELQEDDGQGEASFEGDDIQSAQDKIMSELARLKDSDGQDVAYPFIGKPDRNLYRDYYEIIQHPVSLRSIQQKVRGRDTRKKISKTTAFSTWQSFEEEVSYIWRNAREYNEDGSEISVLAGMLEDHFKRRVAEAKKIVPEPLQVDGHPEVPRIKLKMGAANPEPGTQRLTLKMAGQTSETPSKDDGPSGVAVDNDALKRQQALVRAGSASHDSEAHKMSPRTRSLRRQVGSPKSSAATTPSASEQHHGVSTSARDLAGVIKDETPMASQHAETRSFHGLHGGPIDPAGGALSYDAVPAQQPAEASPLDSIWRRQGQDASSALMRNIQVVTHPSLNLRRNLCLDIPPSSTLSQQNITVTLPPSHHLLTVRPTLAASANERQMKLVALIGMQRLHPAGDASTLAYDIQLHPGTTKVDFEAISGPARGVPKSGPPGSEVDYERVTIFFNLLRGGV